METNDTRNELELMLHMAEPEIRTFLRLLKGGSVNFADAKGLSPDQERNLRVTLCEDWLSRYQELDDRLGREAALMCRHMLGARK